MRYAEPDVAAILAAHRAPGAPADLVRRTRAALGAELAERVARRRALKRTIVWRLATAGTLLLPVVLALDYALWTVVHAVYGLFLPAGVMTAVLTLFVGWCALGLALAYGSLPILGAWALRMRGVLHDAG